MKTDCQDKWAEYLKDGEDLRIAAEKEIEENRQEEQAVSIEAMSKDYSGKASIEDWIKLLEKLGGEAVFSDVKQLAKEREGNIDLFIEMYLGK